MWETRDLVLPPFSCWEMEGREESLIEIISLPFDVGERDEDRHFPILPFPFLQVLLSDAGDAKKTDASGTFFDKHFLIKNE